MSTTSPTHRRLAFSGASAGYANTIGRLTDFDRATVRAGRASLATFHRSLTPSAATIERTIKQLGSEHVLVMAWNAASQAERTMFAHSIGVANYWSTREDAQ